MDVNRGMPWPHPLAIRRCARCVYSEETPAITFDESGICNYCKLHDQMEREYPTGDEGERRLALLVDRIKADGRRKPFDCVVGVSGGCDSSFLLHQAKALGLRPLAAHFDNTWNSATSTENIRRLLQKLDVELFTIVVSNKEYDDIYRSFLNAGVIDVEAPTDIGLAATLYRAAEKHGIKYILEGHSFRTEGISPLGWLYMDGKYIRSVHEQFGTVPMRTYPNMPILTFLRWILLSNIKKVRPLYFMDYRKEEAKALLTERYGWQWYGGHHLENRFTAFFHSYLLPRRFGIDTRVLGFAALVRSGQMSREQALDLIAHPPTCDSELIELVRTRLDLTEARFDELMSLPIRTYREFPSYKPTFERLRPFFWLMYRLDRVSKSFYVKFTQPEPTPTTQAATAARESPPAAVTATPAPSA